MSVKLQSFVRVVIQNEKGESLVIFQKKWDCWVFPGGKIEPNETPLQAAKREVWEETNIIIKNLEIVDKKAFFSDEILKNKIGYLVKANEYLGEIKNKEVEKIADIQFRKIDYDFAINRPFYTIKFK